MSKKSSQLGKQGESLAVDYLESQGYTIVKENFRNRLGEIDIIAQDGDVLCFIEVKARASHHSGSPFEAVEPVKQRKLARVALSYCQNKDLDQLKIRFDAVAVDSSQAEAQVEIIKNAFEIN